MQLSDNLNVLLLLTKGQSKGQSILLFLYLIYAFILFVNNGNILTDWTSERKHLQIKYNEM